MYVNQLNRKDKSIIEKNYLPEKEIEKYIKKNNVVSLLNRVPLSVVLAAMKKVHKNKIIKIRSPHRPTQVHRERTKYTRKEKHKTNLIKEYLL